MDWFFLALNRFSKHIPFHIKIACGVALVGSVIFAVLGRYRYGLMLAALPIIGFVGFTVVDYITDRMKTVERKDHLRRHDPERAVFEDLVSRTVKPRSANPKLPGILITALGIGALLTAYAIERYPKWKQSQSNPVASAVVVNPDLGKTPVPTPTVKVREKTVPQIIEPVATPKPVPTLKPEPKKLTEKQCHEIIVKKGFDPDVYLPSECEQQYSRWKREMETLEYKERQAREAEAEKIRREQARQERLREQEQYRLRQQQRIEERRRYNEERDAENAERERKNEAARIRREKEERDRQRRQQMERLGNTIEGIIRRP